MKRLFTIIIIFSVCFEFSLVSCNFGDVRQDYVLTNSTDYDIEHFILLQNDEILIVANSYSLITKLYVLDVSGENMKTIAETQICNERPYYFDYFMKINESHFFIECQYLKNLIFHNLVYIAYWDGSEIIQVPGNGTLFPGSGFPIQIPPNYPSFYFWGESDQYAYLQAIQSENEWKNLTTPLKVPKGFGYLAQQGGFISADGSYLIGASGVADLVEDKLVAPIWKFSMPDGAVISSIENPTPNSGYPTRIFSGYSSPASIMLITDIEGNLKLNSTFVAYDFNEMKTIGEPLLLTYPDYTIYGGTPPWSLASFYEDYFYIVMSVDKSIFLYEHIIQQMRLPTASNNYTLEMIDAAYFAYKYSHNLIATSNWVYCDTDAARISRWQVVN